MDEVKAGSGSGEMGEAAIKTPGIVQSCILFSITIFLFVFIGYRVQGEEFYSGILITEFGLIMLPALIFIILFRFPAKGVLRLKRTKPANFLVIFGIMIFAIPAAAVFNLLNLLLVNTIFGKTILQPMPMPKSGLELLLSIAVIAGSAGICEEFLFRGVIQRSFERFGVLRSILMAAFLFSITHMDFQKIFGTFFLGVLIGFIVYRSNSLYTGMFAHFTNNAIAVLVGYFSTKIVEFFNASGQAAASAEEVPTAGDLNELFSVFGSLPPQQLILILFFYGFMLLFAVIIFVLLFYLFIRMNPVPMTGIHILARDVGINGGKQRSRLKSLLWLLPGILLIFIIFYIQVRGFIGEGNGFTDIVRKLLGA